MQKISAAADASPRPINQDTSPALIEFTQRIGHPATISGLLRKGNYKYTLHILFAHCSNIKYYCVLNHTFKSRIKNGER
jgi:hypothetical protein